MLTLMIRRHIYTPELLLRCYTIKITIITAQRSQRIASRALNNNLMIFPFFPSECECIVGARYSSQDRPRPKFKCGFFVSFSLGGKLYV